MTKKHPCKTLYLILVLLFLYLPIAVIVIHSFNANESPASAAFGGFTFQWYREMWQSNDLMRTLKNSFIVSFSSVLFSSIIGTPAGIVMAKYQFPGKGFFESLMYMPILLPGIIMGISFLTFFSLLHLPFGYLTMIIGHSTFCIPYTVIMVYTRMIGFDSSLEDASRDLGASSFYLFRTVIWPEVFPAVISAAMLSFAMSLDDVVISFFTAGATTDTLPIKVYSMLKLHGARTINALCTVMILVVVALFMLYQLYNTFSAKKFEEE